MYGELCCCQPQYHDSTCHMPQQVFIINLALSQSVLPLKKFSFCCFVKCLQENTFFSKPPFLLPLLTSLFYFSHVFFYMFCNYSLYCHVTVYLSFCSPHTLKKEKKKLSQFKLEEFCQFKEKITRTMFSAEVCQQIVLQGLLSLTCIVFQTGPTVFLFFGVDVYLQNH